MTHPGSDWSQDNYEAEKRRSEAARRTSEDLAAIDRLIDTCMPETRNKTIRERVRLLVMELAKRTGEAYAASERTDSPPGAGPTGLVNPKAARSLRVAYESGVITHATTADVITLASTVEFLSANRDEDRNEGFREALYQALNIFYTEEQLAPITDPKDCGLIAQEHALGAWDWLRAVLPPPEPDQQQVDHARTGAEVVRLRKENERLREAITYAAKRHAQDQAEIERLRTRLADME